ncbi:unnamed protein product [Allacma fusca]|uniref:Uncharacterized protein n=1 Tax=Allacma fusca TaxID=39272 RepID=A0A8J2LPS3_9HEXA|nr:unnamed protein product [Allacma fusca]
MSLDDYIKSQKKGKGNQRQAKGKPGFSAGGRGGGRGGARNLAQKHKTRYFVPNKLGGANAQSGAPKVIKGARTAGRGRPNGPALVENPGKRKQLKGQFKRINNRVNVTGRVPQRVNRPQNNSRLVQRAQRFGAGNARSGGAKPQNPQLSNRNGAKAFGSRNRNRQNWPRNGALPRAVNAGRVTGPRPLRKNVLASKPGPNIRVRNKRVQQLIQKRIQRARMLLTRKSVALAPKIVLGAPRRGNLHPRNNMQQKVIAQQKLNRARNARTRSSKARRGSLQPQSTNRRSNNSRGLILDRNQVVKVRVANDLPRNAPSYDMYSSHQPQNFYGPTTSYAPIPGAYGYSTNVTQQDEFPPYVLPNNISQRQESVKSTRQVLDPEIQRRISIIQNRARQSRDDSEILEDFKGPVSACKVNPGDRFRMLMN